MPVISSTQKKWRLLRNYVGGYPMWCAWQVTYRCNFRCGFCDYWRDPMGARAEQTVAQFVAGSRKLATMGSQLISLAGGEPLLREDLPQIVEAVAEYHLPFVTTNGYRMTPQRAEALFAAGLWGASVSIDYADAALHDRRRGQPGAYERAVAALRQLSAARKYAWQRVNLMAVLLHDNLDHMEPLIRLARDCDAYFMLQPYSIRKTGSQHFCSREARVSERLLDLRGRYSNFLSNPFFLHRFDAALDGGVAGCMAGRAFFNIDSVGDVAVCVERRDRPVGNLYRDAMRTLVERMRAEASGNRCRDCWYNCRGEVEGLYHPGGLWRSLPTLLFDRGRPPPG